jgi:uncharacterized protein (DUF2132 family)
MKPYKFSAKGSAVVVIGEEQITFSPSTRHPAFRKTRWAREDVLAVSVEAQQKIGVGRTLAFGVVGAMAKRRVCEVSVFHKDGSVRRFRGVRKTAAEVGAAFAVRGYTTR